VVVFISGLLPIASKYCIIFLSTSVVATGVGSIPALSCFTQLLQANLILNMLVGGLISSAIAVAMTLVPKKGMVLMSILVITTSLVAGGEMV
jgi:hypothetical protein